MNLLSPSALFRVFLLALVFFLAAREIKAADIPDAFTVSRITIQGPRDIKKKKIRSSLYLLPPAAWRFWKRHPVATEQDVSDDADRITLLYQRNGFYHATVTYDIVVSEPADDGPAPNARIVYTVDEGTPVSVDEVVIRINGASTPLSEETLLEKIPLQRGVRFEEALYRDSKKMLITIFGSHGYPSAQVSGKALVYRDSDRADITLSIDPGKFCLFGETTVVWDRPIVNEKILSRSRTYQPGQIYDISKVEKSQRNLYDLDIFRAAVIDTGEPDDVTFEVPLTLELKRRKSRNIKLGAGYGDEDGVRMKAGFTYRNPFKWAGKLSFEARKTDLITKGSAAYNQPYFLDSRGALQAETGLLQEFLDSYENRELFGNLKYTRDLGRKMEMTLAYMMEYNELLDLNLVDIEEIRAFHDDNTDFISSFFVELVRNTADSETDPASGSVLSGSIETASTLLGSQLTYINPAAELREYVSLPLQVTFAARIRLETIIDIENNQNIPIFKRLFLGGANTVRGYAYQKLGPLDDTGNPEGGLSSVLANIELRRPIIGLLSMVLFLDAGMLDDSSFAFSREQLRYSTGGGLRLGTLIGPIRLDFGYRLNPSEEDTADRWRLHLNIGHAF